MNGAGILNAIQALSQLSYGPIFSHGVGNRVSGTRAFRRAGYAGNP